MALTLAQKQTLKTWLLANAEGLNDEQAATALNAAASPAYWVWRSGIARGDVYHATGPGGSTWDWATYKAQGATEQNAWTQMFMGDSGPIGNQNFRSGVLAIFSGSGGPATQRAHVFAVGRRTATVAEKLFAAAVVSPPANTGNASGDARGAATNPDNLTFEGLITTSDVSEANNS